MGPSTCWASGRERASENTEVTRALLEDLVARGLDPARRRLFVIDGSKALRKAIDQVFGPQPVQENARLLADFTATERRKNILAGLTKLGTAKAVTLDALIHQYHTSSTAKGWGNSHRSDKERGRKFWLSVLDGERDVLDLNRESLRAPIVAALKNGMSPRVAKKRLSYIRSGVLWGRDESRLFDTNPIQGLKIQKITKYRPNTKDLI